MFALNLVWLLISILLLNRVHVVIGENEVEDPDLWCHFQQKCRDECVYHLWNTTRITGCTNGRDGEFHNQPIINNAYCYNNGTGLCKAFSGRFEFYLNTFQDKFIGPVEESKYVDNTGYHKRVPVSYTVDGKINYADRAINWAELYAKDYLKGGTNILNSNILNWCDFAVKNFWPYKTSFRYYNKKEDVTYRVYFYCRQTCIFNEKTKRVEFYNSRFMFKSNLRIDMDTNPTIFAMEDKLVSDPERRIQLVKHKREWWYEVGFSVSSANNATLYIDNEMKRSGCLICKNLNLLTRKAYGDKAGFCISDYFNQHDIPHLNNAQCGLNQVEVADFNYLSFSMIAFPFSTYEISVHNVPAYEHFSLARNRVWFWGAQQITDLERMSEPTITVSAATSIPIEGSRTTVEVILLYNYAVPQQEAGSDKEIGDRLDNYPIPYLSRYETVFRGGRFRYKEIASNREKNKVKLTNLNQMEDIAYLYECPSILAIFGPFYSQFDHKTFGAKTLNEKTQTDSIIKIGMWELPSAFYNQPLSNIIWVYYRTSYLAQLSYRCEGNGKLISATQLFGGKYYATREYERPNKLPYQDKVSDYQLRSEETFFSDLKLFKKRYSQLEHQAPNPRNFPFDMSDDSIESAPNETWIYVLIAVGLMLIMLMSIVCLMALRRRRLRRNYGDKFVSQMTARSRLRSLSGSSAVTRRDPLSSKSLHSISRSRATLRPSVLGRSRSSNRTLSSHASRKAASSASHSRSKSVASSKLSRKPSQSRKQGPSHL